MQPARKKKQRASKEEEEQNAQVKHSFLLSIMGSVQEWAWSQTKYGRHPSRSTLATEASTKIKKTLSKSSETSSLHHAKARKGFFGGCRPYFVCDHAHSFHYVEANTCLYHTDLNLTSESPRVSRRSSDTIIEVVGCPPFERKRVLNTNGKEARVL